MFKLRKIALLTFMLLHVLICLAAEEELESSKNSSKQIADNLWTGNVTSNISHKLTETKEAITIQKESSDDAEDGVAPDPLNSPNATPEATNRTGRQLFYSPSFFFIQNYGNEGAKCVTSRGLVGVCKSLNNCLQNQNHLFSIQQWPAQAQILPYLQQQQEFCTFYDQFARASYGICCLDMQNVVPAEKPTADIPVMPAEQNSQQPESIDDSEVLEADLNSFQPPPPTYDNTDNTIDYDPIENLKQASWLNYNNNYIRYPWAQQQFLGFSGVQQWPPLVPTHPPSIASWPPPLPTHPPNHHYPTHPPLNGINGGGGANSHPITSSTTRRPTFPSYPSKRPPTSSSSTSSTTSTTKKPDSTTNSMFGLPLQCGLKSIEIPDQERIVGGTNASPNEFPWIAVLFKSGKQFCGGSLITKNHILTAAHCVARMTSWDVAALTVHLGDYNIRTDFEVKHTTRRIKRLVRHKGFDFSTLHNDIAILTLNEPVQFSKEIQPICLPTSTTQQSRSYSGHIATVAGWGSLRENGPQPSILQKVQIPIWTNSECAQKYGRAAPAGIISSMICAGQVAKDSCSGDSGGPLIVNDGARYIQVGIVSWGIGCGKGQYPGVYTRVTSLLPWIYKNIK